MAYIDKTTRERQARSATNMILQHVEGLRQSPNLGARVAGAVRCSRPTVKSMQRAESALTRVPDVAYADVGLTRGAAGDALPAVASFASPFRTIRSNCGEVQSLSGLSFLQVYAYRLAGDSRAVSDAGVGAEAFVSVHAIRRLFERAWPVGAPVEHTLGSLGHTCMILGACRGQKADSLDDAGVTRIPIPVSNQNGTTGALVAARINLGDAVGWSVRTALGNDQIDDDDRAFAHAFWDSSTTPEQAVQAALACDPAKWCRPLSEDDRRANRQVLALSKAREEALAH